MLIRSLLILFCVVCIVDSVSHRLKESESSNFNRRPLDQPIDEAAYKHEFYREKRYVEIIPVEVIEVKIVESMDSDTFTSLSDTSGSKLSFYDRYGYYTAPSIHGNEGKDSLYDMENLYNHRFEAATSDIRLPYQNSVDHNLISLRPHHDPGYFYPYPQHEYHNEIFSPNLSHDRHQLNPPGYNYYLPSKLPFASDNKNNSEKIEPSNKTDTVEAKKETDSLNNNMKNQPKPAEDNSTVTDYSPSSPEAMIDVRFNVP